MKVQDIINLLNDFAALGLQDDFDNSGLNVGNAEQEVNGILITLDVTPEVIEEAISLNCNLIIAHHPLIFGKLKKINGNNYVEKSIIMAIKNDIAIYCGHTNFDQVFYGVSSKLCDKLGVQNREILSPKNNSLKKISVFVPENYAEQVRNSMFDAGAGKIGNYSNCSYNINGKGSFRANSLANPFVGKIGETHFENETKIEMIYPDYAEKTVVKAMLQSHPYEEVAYDLIKLENQNNFCGYGMSGTINEIDEITFLEKIKKIFQLKTLKHSPLLNKPINKISVCGGSGAFLIENAKRSKSQVFITADIKYHDYFLAENQILLIDIGHYESEQFTKEIFYDVIIKKYTNFAVHISKINTNPIKVY